MSSRSSSPSILSDNDSELSSSVSENVPEIIEGVFIPYDENLELVATQEEAAKKKNVSCFNAALLARSRPIHGMYCLNNHYRATSPNFVILNCFLLIRLM